MAKKAKRVSWTKALHADLRKHSKARTPVAKIAKQMKRTVGALRQQVRNTVWLEAVAIGVIGLVLGLMLGAAQLYYSLEVTRRDLVGIDYGYSYPYTMALVLLPVILSAAFLAALGPAESAVRGSLVEALEYE